MPVLKLPTTVLLTPSSAIIFNWSRYITSSVKGTQRKLKILIRKNCTLPKNMYTLFSHWLLVLGTTSRGKLFTCVAVWRRHRPKTVLAWDGWLYNYDLWEEVHVWGYHVLQMLWQEVFVVCRRTAIFGNLLWQARVLETFFFIP